MKIKSKVITVVHYVEQNYKNNNYFLKKSVILIHIHLYFLQELQIVLLYSFFINFGLLHLQ